MAQPPTPTPSKPPRPPLSQIEAGLCLGDSMSSTELEILEAHKVNAVLSVVAARYRKWQLPWYRQQVPAGRHMYVPCWDGPTQDLLANLMHICDFIHANRQTGTVLVHCMMGVSRSATAVVAHLMRIHKWSVSEALEFVGKRREERMEALGITGDEGVGIEILRLLFRRTVQAD